jgi:hypothetical protein
MSSSGVDIIIKILKEHGDRCNRINMEFRPEGLIKYLIIGESPPSNGTYFYIPKKLRQNSKSLPSQVFSSLLGLQEGIDKFSYERYLNRLKSKFQFYLIDLCQIPINFLFSKNRVKVIRAEFNRFILKFDFLELSPDTHKILVLPASVINEIKLPENREFLLKLIGIIGIQEEEICRFSDLERKLKNLKKAKLDKK